MDEGAANELLDRLYDELHRVAGQLMRKERPGHSLQASDLIDEAYFRVLKGARPEVNDRAHLFRLAARTMRRILVEHARAVAARKRAGCVAIVSLHDTVAAVNGADFDVIAVDEALDELAALNARHAQVIELRYFAGLTMDEAAIALDVSPRTVGQDSRVALAWLRRRLAS